ncbi:MarR family winged helix-turn-helix transcriptional regulator [Lentzea tibetensis]|nr:MarR family transcriptional regulator [Lentzea tibetensis]
MTDRVDQLLDQWRTELPEALGPTSELGKRVMMIAGALVVATNRTLPGFELTGAEFDVLLALRRSGAPYRLKANELSNELLLSTGGTSNVVNRLEARHLVAREPDPSDGRSTLVRLTDEGKALAEKAAIANGKAHDEVLNKIPEKELEAATKALKAVFGHL